MKFLPKAIQLLESRWSFYIAGILFRLVLEFSYIDFVHPLYEYAGFGLTPDSTKYLESWMMYLAMLACLPAQAHRPSDYLICVCFFAYMAPLLVFYSYASPARWILYGVAMQYTIIGLLRASRHRLALAPPKHGPKIAWVLCIGTIVGATVWMLTSAGLSNFNLDLDAVYEFREDANNTIYSGLPGYAVVWATTVAGPFLLMIALRDRRRLLTLGVLTLHIFWFGVSSHKSVLFYPALVISLYTLFKHSRAMSLIPIGMGLALGISLAAYHITESLFLGGMFIRRVFFVPSFLTFTYFDYFNTHSFVYWSNSLLSWLIPYPYDESVALVIGNHLNDPTLWANNSFFSASYMHAGVLGITIYGLAAGLLMKALDSLTGKGDKGVPLWIVLSVVIVPFNTLFTSADLTTTLLTHGLGFGMLIMYLMSSSQANRVAVISTNTDNNQSTTVAIKPSSA